MAGTISPLLLSLTDYLTDYSHSGEHSPLVACENLGKGGAQKRPRVDLWAGPKRRQLLGEVAVVQPQRAVHCRQQRDRRVRKSAQELALPVQQLQ